MQVNLHDRAYILENMRGTVDDVVKSLAEVKQNPQEKINNHVQESVGAGFF